MRQAVKIFTALILISSSTVSFSMANATPRPFKAKYEVGDNSVTVGEVRFSLTQENENWIFLTKTKPTGFFKLVGDKLKAEERVQLVEKNDQLLPIDWYSDSPRNKKGKETAKFDWIGQNVTSHFRGETKELPLNGPTFDRLSIYLEVNRQISPDKNEITLSLMDRHGVNDITIKKVGTEEIRVPAGTYQTIITERTKGRRTIRAWHAPEYDNMPVKVEHYKDNKLKVRMKLKKFEHTAL